jgi:hypothetical protein
MPCNLRPTPEDPLCEIKGPAGSVQLKAVGTFGSIVFTAADYNGQELITSPVDTITVPIVEGKKKLHLVFGFSAGAAGRGKMIEVCDSNNVLDDNVRGDDQSKTYRICASAPAAAAPAKKAAAEKATAAKKAAHPQAAKKVQS